MNGDLLSQQEQAERGVEEGEGRREEYTESHLRPALSVPSTLSLYLWSSWSRKWAQTTRLWIDFGSFRIPSSLIHRQLAKVAWMATRSSTVRRNGQLATSTTSASWGDNWGSLSRGNSIPHKTFFFFLFEIILIIFTLSVYFFYLPCHMRVESEYQNRCVEWASECVWENVWIKRIEWIERTVKWSGLISSSVSCCQCG